MNSKKLLLTAFALAMVNASLVARHGGPHYYITNKTQNQIRIEGINTCNPTDLYFSDITNCKETIEFLGGTGYPNLGLIAKHPKNHQVYARTEELPYKDAQIILTQDGDKYSFVVQKK